MKTLSIISALFLTGAALPAFAEDSEGCTKAPKEQWLSTEQIKSKLGEQGYKVEKVEIEGGCAEAKGEDAKGKRVELYVDPATANITEKDD